MNASEIIPGWVGAWLRKLEKDALAIEKEEVRLATSPLPENPLEEADHNRAKRRLTAKAATCRKKVRAIRQKLQDLCGHENKKMVAPGESWYCPDCGKINYEPPEH